MTAEKDRGLTKAQIGLLRQMAHPEVYCVSISVEERDALEPAGLIKWVPGQAWSGPRTYTITDLGRAALSPTSTQP